jgi:hypothetical protein
MNKQAKVSPPWFTYYKKVAELFKRDDEVIPVYNDENKKLTLNVKNYEKAQALRRLIPETKTFGNVTVDIEIKYAEDGKSMDETFRAAFKNNPAFKYTFTFETSTNPIMYVVFEKSVVQYWNDDMSDPNGITSTLYENIADDVLEAPGVIYSTESAVTTERLNKYNKHHATEEEIKCWEKYNGIGTFFSKESPKKNGEYAIDTRTGEILNNPF